MNNNILNPIAVVLLAATAVSCALPAAAQASGIVPPREVHFEGTDRNWFNPANWSSGRVPGPRDCVILDGNDDVLIDPALGGGATARAHDMIIIAAARLETLPGTVLETTGETIAPTARMLMRSSAEIGGDLIVDQEATAASGSGAGGVWLNPTPKSKRIIVLQSSFTMQFGLGGRTPASVTRDLRGRIQVANGYGHYATMTASKTMTLAGDLWLNLHYGFKPARGDRFQIMSAAGRSSGTFTGLPEGALAACTDDGVGLSITYRGGDGNDVELIAADASRAACAAPTVQPMFQISDRLAITDPGIAQTREHILLARQVGV